MELLAASMVLALLMLNIVATIRIIQCDDFEPNQRTMQFMIVWLLPIIGALVVLYHSRVREPQSGIAKAGDDIYQGQVIRPREVDAPADD